jgi:hypothetical protein
MLQIVPDVSEETTASIFMMEEEQAGNISTSKDSIVNYMALKRAVIQK